MGIVFWAPLESLYEITFTVAHIIDSSSAGPHMTWNPTALPVQSSSDPLTEGQAPYEGPIGKP